MQPKKRTRTRRSAILEAAEESFGRHGWHGTRVEDVAAAAGVSKGLVFNYWEGKDALFDEVWASLSHRFRGWVEHAVTAAGPTDPLHLLSVTLEAAALFFASYPAGAIVLSPIRVPKHPDSFEGEVDAFGDFLEVHVLEGLSTLDPDLRPLAAALVTGAAGGLLGAWTTMPAFGLDQATAVVTRFCVGGLANMGPVEPAGRRPPRTRRPPVMTAGRISATERRRLLLDAALDVFATDGYDSARLEDIADAAGVTKALIFKHWPSKEALFLDVRSNLFAQIEAEMVAAVAMAGTPMDKIVAAGDALIDWHYANPSARPVLAPVPTLPPSAQDDAGTSQLVRIALEYPAVAAAARVLPLVAPALTGAGRAAIRQMHLASVHPVVIKAAFRDFVTGALAAVAEGEGTRIEGADYYIRTLSEWQAGSGPQPEPASMGRSPGRGSTRGQRVPV